MSVDLQTRLGPLADERVRSNSAKAPKMWKISHPLPDSVSIGSFRLYSPTLWLRNALARAMSSLNERLSRSSRQTTNVSPVRRYASASRRPGRTAKIC